MVWMQLGDIHFEGNYGPELMDKTSAANYAEHALTEGKPRLQRLGSKLTTISMGIRLHRQFCVPENKIAEMASARDTGTILPLITGAGDVMGDFVITDITETTMRLADDGSMIEVGIQLTLKEYSTPDRATSVKNAARKDAFALEENNPVPAAPGATQMVESEASEGVTAVAANSKALEDSTKRAADVPAQEEVERKKMEFRLGQIVAKASRVKSIINDFDGDMYTGTRDLDDVLLTLINSATSIIALVAGGTAIAPIRTQVDLLMVQVRDMKAAAAFMNSINARRQ